MDLEERIVELIKEINEENRLADKRAKQLYDLAAGDGGDTIPIGLMSIWGTNTPPADWLLCDGTAVSRTTYSDLFAVIGTTFGAGDESTTFNLPDFRQKFPLGKAASGTGSSLGDAGGTIDYVHLHAVGTLAAANESSHTHTTPNHTHVLPNHRHTQAHRHASPTSVGHDRMCAKTGWGSVSTTVNNYCGHGTGGASWTHNHSKTYDPDTVNTGYYQGTLGNANPTTNAGSAHTHVLSGNVANSAAYNPPFLAINFIIKH